MANNTAWLITGIGVGVAVGIGVALLWQQQTQNGQSEPGMTVHDVIRDDAGRIQTVETVSKIGTIDTR